MTRIVRLSLCLAVICVSARPLLAAPIINGSRTGDLYGAPLAIQTVETNFGDNNNFNPGSELDAAYARIEGGKLYLMLTGNLEDNFNKLVVFFDSKPGGQNVLDTDSDNFGTNPVVDPSPYPSDPGMFAKMGKAPYPSAFDSGFSADFVLILRNGFTGFGNRFDIDYAVLGGNASQYLGVFDPTTANSGLTLTGANGAPIQVGFDNSNINGVVGGTGPADQLAAAAVTSGVEIAISLADLGNPSLGSTIKVVPFINNSNHDYVSNQFLGGLDAPHNNLGSDGFGNFEANKTSFDLSAIPGNQYFEITVVPEPSSVLLASLAVVGLIAGRRK